MQFFHTIIYSLIPIQFCDFRPRGGKRMAGSCSMQEIAEDSPTAQPSPEGGLSPEPAGNDRDCISRQHPFPQQHFPVDNLNQLNPAPQAVPWSHGEVGPDAFGSRFTLPLRRVKD
jgi:hypothetical protein